MCRYSGSGYNPLSFVLFLIIYTKQIVMELTTLFTTEFWYYAPILSMLTVTIAGAINGKFNITEGFWPQLVAWITGSVLTVVGWFIGLIPLGTPTWLAVVCLCGVVGLSSNGIYDIPFIKSIIDKLLPSK
jgi:hypothetical protein